MPENSFTLINDEENNIYLAKVKKFNKHSFNEDENQLKEYIKILKNDKY